MVEGVSITTLEEARRAFGRAGDEARTAPLYLAVGAGAGGRDGEGSQGDAIGGQLPSGAGRS